MVFYVFLCRSVCWFLYGPFCHVALNLTYIYIVYNILYLNISLFCNINLIESLQAFTHNHSSGHFLSIIPLIQHETFYYSFPVTIIYPFQSKILSFSGSQGACVSFDISCLTTGFWNWAAIAPKAICLLLKPCACINACWVRWHLKRRFF